MADNIEVRNIEVRNMEGIIELLKPHSKQVNKFRKFDGITIECTVLNAADRDNGIKEIKAICKKLKLAPVSVEKKASSEVAFGVQFPELTPIYTEEEIRKMYEANYKFLFDNLKSADKTKFTRAILLDNMTRLVRNSIMTYCKSNINLYKDKPENYYNNVEYRAKLNSWFVEYLEKYLSEEV